MAKYHVRIERTITEIGYAIVEAKDEASAADAVTDEMYGKGEDGFVHWCDSNHDDFKTEVFVADDHDQVDLEAKEEANEEA